ncbi:unnamed protein product [Arabidopsis lyrata]|uniref:Predicted protein n=1 Tax=Arabidopsis lyrata subsp. lyrata TaxID=81972 RepID=D7LAL1_ARALL|nr:predicted protein [Arabidopsis lyrata subsp. lyrata]CAH8258999.1 unnamed protein product [Arabidopsis lyrata]
MLAHLEDHPDIYLSACEQEQTLNRDHAESEFCRCTGKSLIVMNNQSSFGQASSSTHRLCRTVGLTA